MIEVQALQLPGEEGTWLLKGNFIEDFLLLRFFISSDVVFQERSFPYQTDPQAVHQFLLPFNSISDLTTQQMNQNFERTEGIKDKSAPISSEKFSVDQSAEEDIPSSQYSDLS